jgi:DNA-directed RNA polymerase delta subunit
MSRTTENKEEILKIHGELKLIKTLLDNHVSHISKRIDTIYKIIWAVSFMALGNLIWVVRSLMN